MEPMQVETRNSEDVRLAGTQERSVGRKAVLVVFLGVMCVSIVLVWPTAPAALAGVARVAGKSLRPASARDTTVQFQPGFGSPVGPKPMDARTPLLRQPVTPLQTAPRSTQVAPFFHGRGPFIDGLDKRDASTMGMTKDSSTAEVPAAAVSDAKEDQPKDEAPTMTSAVTSAVAAPGLVVATGGGPPDPEAAWAQYEAAGDSLLLTTLVRPLTVLTPGTGKEVVLGGLMGEGKGLAVFMRHIGWPFCWELAHNIAEMLPQLQAADVTVAVITVASPQKAAEFVEAQGELPLSTVFCSKDLSAYKGLGFYDNFGAALGAANAGLLPLQKIMARGPDGLKEMSKSVENYTKVSPVGLVSGRAFAIEDAKAATQLGGALAFDSGKVVFAHRDKAVADHVDLTKALESLGVSVAAKVSA